MRTALPNQSRLAVFHSIGIPAGSNSLFEKVCLPSRISHSEKNPNAYSQSFKSGRVAYRGISLNCQNNIVSILAIISVLFTGLSSNCCSANLNIIRQFTGDLCIFNASMSRVTRAVTASSSKWSKSSTYLLISSLIQFLLSAHRYTVRKLVSSLASSASAILAQSSMLCSSISFLSGNCRFSSFATRWQCLSPL